MRRQEWQSYIKVLQTSHRDREGMAAGCEEIWSKYFESKQLQSLNSNNKQISYKNLQNVRIWAHSVVFKLLRLDSLCLFYYRILHWYQRPKQLPSSNIWPCPSPFILNFLELLFVLVKRNISTRPHYLLFRLLRLLIFRSWNATIPILSLMTSR